jgi:E3 ubiquitin-protein ligase mind-bomb
LIYNIVSYKRLNSFVVESSNTKEKLTQNQSLECIICNELRANVLFEPCQHLLLCELCSVRIKKCIKCHQIITAKVVKESNRQLIDSNNISSQSVNKVGNNSNSSLNNRNNHNNNNNQKVSAERLKYLESKIAEIEEANSCTIYSTEVRIESNGVV